MIDSRLHGLLLVLFVCLTIPAATLLAQQESATQPETGDETPEAPDKVDVSPIARDDEIAQRLTDILNSTDWFESPNVRVENGVVFLTGTASEQEFKKWAGDLARNTQDVAAVVNRIGIEEKPIWDFSPAITELKAFQTSAVQGIPIFLFAIALLIVTWLVARLVGFLFQHAFTGKIPNNLLRWVATRAAMLPVLIFGIYLILRISGLTQLALTVLGGTGLIGLIIGIAFQDIAENFLASILISVRQPFRIGDLIQVGEHSGIVDRVTTRGTTILTVDGNHVQIPNSHVYKNTIINYTANPLRRIQFEIGIGYDDSVSQAQTVLLQTVKQHGAVIDDPAPKVVVEGLGAATVNLSVLFWVDTTQRDWVAVRSSLMRQCKLALMESEISLPDEAREVIFPNGVPVQMLRPEAGVERLDGVSDSNAAAVEIPSHHDESNSHCSSTPQQELEYSDAEGNMETEMDELKRQATKSWNPDEGQGILPAEAAAMVE